MFDRIFLLLSCLCLLFCSCEQEVGEPSLDFERDYQPLEIGKFWVYQVEETIHYGENDSESADFFYRDLVRSSYLNAENELVYIVTRSKSTDRISWALELEYTMIYRDQTLLRTIDNTPLVALVFPPEIGKSWNGRVYQAEGDDDFEIEPTDAVEVGGNGAIPAIRVSQEDLDDRVTIRDIRYEVFGKGVGLVEKYDEVLTYCSRNDCLGNELISSGSKTHLILMDYGNE